MNPADCYLDAAATSRHKAPGVVSAMVHALEEVGASPGRGTYEPGLAASRLIAQTREDLAELLGVQDSARVIFTAGCTSALNTVLSGLLKLGDRVLLSGVEHNAVMRPLMHLAQHDGIKIERCPVDSYGRIQAEDVIQRLSQEPIALVILTHASNVSGAIQPVEAIATAARACGIPVLLDAAQTAGCLPIACDRWGIDYLAFSGHKGLLGPQGTGGLVVPATCTLEPLIRGGTGSRSQEEIQPIFLPDRLESGTPNTPGIAGLGAAVKYLLHEGVENIRRRSQPLIEHLLQGLAQVPHLCLYSPQHSQENIGIAAFTLDSWDPAELADRLWQDHRIMVRAGLHCAPSAHRALETFPHGSVRASIGSQTNTQDIDRLIQALHSYAK